MNIEKVKDKINLFKGKTVSFKFNGTRNKNEEFKGVITQTYPEVFIIKIADDMVRCFSYSDVLIRKLVIRED